MGQVRQQPGPAAGAPALHGPLRDTEYLSRVGDRVVEHVHKHQRNLLVVRQLPQGGLHLERDITPGRRIGVRPASGDGVKKLFVTTADFWPCGAPPHPVEAGVHHDAVQPGRHRGIAAEGSGPAERRDHRVLQRVGGILWVGQGADRYRPQPVPVPQEELPEGIGIAGDMQLEQVCVGRLVLRMGGRRCAPLQAGGGGWNLGRAWRGQGPPGAGAARLLRFRRVSRCAVC